MDGMEIINSSIHGMILITLFWRIWRVLLTHFWKMVISWNVNDSLLCTTSDFPDKAGHAAVLLRNLNLTEADLGWIEGETNSKTELGVHQ